MAYRRSLANRGGLVWSRSQASPWVGHSSPELPQRSHKATSKRPPSVLHCGQSTRGRPHFVHCIWPSSVVDVGILFGGGRSAKSSGRNDR